MDLNDLSANAEKISREQFTDEFAVHRPQLRSFLLRMTASPEDTEDLLQDTYIRASENLSSFRQRSSLKTWLFTIAGNLAKNSLRSKKRWPANAADSAKTATMNSPEIMQGFMNIHQGSPHGAFEIREHIGLCFTCIGKTLPIEEQLAILLKEVYDFKVKEIAEILNRTDGVIKHLLGDGRHTMTAIFEHRCSLITKNGICHQCSELNGIFNPGHETQKELMKLELVKEAATKDSSALFDLRTQIVRAVDPYHSTGCDLQLFHLQHVRTVAEQPAQQ
ncbi:MAG TPA: sigma-70 family RNA polymerase sigma factor [Puia sp.]|nr:sigma-70 family RNA polymerase sigma factor [Puia sp.]